MSQHRHDCAKWLPREARRVLTDAAIATGNVWFVYWDEERRRHRIWFDHVDAPWKAGA